MKLSLFLVTVTLMGCSTHHHQRMIASEPGDIVTRTFQKEISNESPINSNVGFDVYASGTSKVISDLFSGMVMGESEVSFSIPSQAITEDIIADLKLKRAFFYDKSKKPDITVIKNLKISLNDVQILKYQRPKKSEHFKGSIFVVNTEKKAQARRFFRQHLVLGDVIKSISQIKSGLVIELIDDPVANEKFKEVVTNKVEALEEIGVKEIDMCSEKNCLDLSAEEVNLLHLGKEELKFHAIGKAGKLPESSKFDGFVEFEYKMQLDGFEED